MKPEQQFWNIDESSAKLLQALIFALRPMHILEVGTSNGYSAIQMGIIAQQYGGKIDTIEFFEERAALAQKNIDEHHLSSTISLVRGDALQVLQQFSVEKQQYDFMFLDANKEEYAEYFHYSMLLAKPGTIIIADNTISHAKKLSSFFSAVAAEKRVQALPLSVGAGLMILQVTK